MCAVGYRELGYINLTGRLMCVWVCVNVGHWHDDPGCVYVWELFQWMWETGDCLVACLVWLGTKATGQISEPHTGRIAPSEMSAQSVWKLFLCILGTCEQNWSPWGTVCEVGDGGDGDQGGQKTWCQEQSHQGWPERGSSRVGCGSRSAGCLAVSLANMGIHRQCADKAGHFTTHSKLILQIQGRTNQRILTLSHSFFSLSNSDFKLSFSSMTLHICTFSIAEAIKEQCYNCIALVIRT